MSSPNPSDPGNFTRRTPVGDDRERLVCDDCGFIQYENPKILSLKNHQTVVLKSPVQLAQVARKARALDAVRH
ncbi:MAG: zinc ribbon domain-containing protein, partial [Ectothiorhodospiraceae bacterium]